LRGSLRRSSHKLVAGKFANGDCRNIPQGTSPIADEIDGASATSPQSTDGGEALLDINAALEIIYPQNVTVFTTSSDVQDDGDGFFDNFLDAIDGSYCDSSSGN
jgi:tripeptidyl-peptidase-1